jgi:uncharacterized OB-fold protein
MTGAGKRVWPVPDADTETYWDAARGGDLLIQWCPRCQRHQFYPRLLCTACLQPVVWRAAKGFGVVYASTVVHRPPGGYEEFAPYAVCLVDLDEGVRLMTSVNEEEEPPTIGQRVRIKMAEVEEGLFLPVVTAERP